MLFKGKGNEKKDFEILYHGISNDILKGRIRTTGEWYINNAYLYKWLYYIVGFSGIAIPIAVTVVNGVYYGNSDFVQFFTIIASAITALATSFLSFSKCHEKWTLYRMTLEKIKRELALYWAGHENEEDLKILVTNLEKYMEEENMEWLNISVREKNTKENDLKQEK